MTGEQPSTTAAVRLCPVCLSTDGRSIHHQRFALFDDHGLGTEYTVLACRRCGVGYADVSADQDRYDELYARLSRYAVTQSLSDSDVPEARERFTAIASDIAEAVADRDALLLDIGCADGGLLTVLSQAGFRQLWGVDPSPACVQYASRVPHARVEVGSLFSLPAALPPVEVAVLSHVLEHVREVRPALRALRARMAPGAILYVEVPDASRYADFMVAPFQDFNTEHINHFSSTSLNTLLRLEGFDPIRTGDRILFPAAGIRYPAVFALASTRETPDVAVMADRQLGPALDTYVARSLHLLAEIDSRIRETLTRHQDIVVWGTGELLAKLLADTALSSARIGDFVDGNPVNQGRLVNGHAVIGPDQLGPSDCPIIITSILHAGAIERAIRARGLTNPIVRFDDLRAQGTCQA